MNFKTTISKRVFPFAPKILWTLNSGKYVKPKLPKIVIDRSIKNKTIVVSAFGNIFESFFSMSLLELFSKESKHPR
jgi:transposase